MTDQKPPMILASDSQLPKISKSDTRRRLSSEERNAVRKSMEAALDNAGQGGFVCQKQAWCVAMLDNGDILVTIENAAYLGPACDTGKYCGHPRSAAARSLPLRGNAFHRS